MRRGGSTGRCTRRTWLTRSAFSPACGASSAPVRMPDLGYHSAPLIPGSNLLCTRSLFCNLPATPRVGMLNILRRYSVQTQRSPAAPITASAQGLYTTATGRVAEARALCQECGQPWRAASLGGGGGWGPTPLGPAAAEADAADPSGELADELADQVNMQFYTVLLLSTDHSPQVTACLDERMMDDMPVHPSPRLRVRGWLLCSQPAACPAFVPTGWRMFLRCAVFEHSWWLSIYSQ